MISMSFGQDKKAPSEVTPEMRQKMAEAHQKMADCLKSKKPIESCRQEMMQSCKAMGPHGCPMHDGMWMGMHHRMHGGGMPVPSASPK